MERFQALVENSSDAISLINAEGQVLYASASTAAVLGYQPEELLGQNGLDLFHPQDRDDSVRTLKKVLAKPQSHDRLQARVCRKDGEWRWVESTVSNLLDEPHVGAIVINYREIEARRAEEEERQLRLQELTRRNAELQAFAHTVAHDLREPLRMISAFTELLVGKAQLDDPDKEIARFIVDGVKRMSIVLDDLLNSAETGFRDSRQPVDLANAASQALQNLRIAIRSSGAAVTLGPLPMVLGIESDLIRLFQNLIGNALKYRGQAEVHIQITAERSGPDWIVRIRDNGPGIAKENHRRVFGLFTRLDATAVPGVGLGLAMCKQIVEGSGGTIWVESETGLGSTFCFTVAAEDSVTPVVPAEDDRAASMHS